MMSELPGMPWGKVFLNLIWVFGAAMLVVLFSYYMFHIRSKGRNLRKSLGTGPLKKYFLSGTILIAAGIVSTGLLFLVSKKPNVIFVSDKVNIPIQSFYGSVIRKKKFLIFSENGIIRSDKVQFERSKYLIHIVSRGSKILEETARLKIFIGMYEIADFFVPVTFEERTFEFNCRRKERWRIRIEYVNDYFDPVKKLNRNSLIKSVKIEKTGKKEKSL